MHSALWWHSSIQVVAPWIRPCLGCHASQYYLIGNYTVYIKLFTGSMCSVNPYDMIHCLHSLYHIIWYTVTCLPESTPTIDGEFRIRKRLGGRRQWRKHWASFIVRLAMSDYTRDIFICVFVICPGNSEGRIKTNKLIWLQCDRR